MRFHEVVFLDIACVIQLDSAQYTNKIINIVRGKYVMRIDVALVGSTELLVA